MENGGAPNIQNDYFNQVRREKKRIAVFLNSGKRLTGRIKSFDKFTILLETSQGEQIVFKHAISTVGPSGTAPAPRSREGFNNRMNIGKGRPAPAASRETRPETAAPAVSPPEPPATPEPEESH
jgi:host factor-I protein